MARHTIDADVAVIGSGFAGALTALILRRQGRSVALLERGRHPRFAIGESTTPIANLVIEELADRWNLPRIRAFSKWGTWRAAYPDVACGLKRGFTFFRHDFDRRFEDTAAHARQLLVAASPNDAISDTHWYRPDFDHWLVREAGREGVRYVDELTLSRVRFEGPGVVLEGERREEAVDVRAGFLVDASGPRGFLAKALGLAEPSMRWLPGTQGLYGHFAGVQRWDALNAADGTPPYPIDDAAVHHVFPGGWIWILRFANGLTSAGAAVTDRLAAELRLSEGGPAWTRLLDRLPSVRDQFARAEPTFPLVHTPRIGFRVKQVVGPNWALLPSAAGVIDPLLSTGFALTLLGIQRLTDAMAGLGPADPGPPPGLSPASPHPLPGLGPGSARPQSGLGPGSVRARPGLVDYERQTQAELDATEQLVAALYASMADFEAFKRLTLLYFAAASYSEAVRRLGHPEKAPGFLLHADPGFGRALRRCVASVLTMPDASGDPRAARTRLFAEIDLAIEPFDIAGLRDRSRRDWYPALAADLVAGAPKLGATESEIDLLLARSGFAAEEPDAGPSLP
jgi:tetracycline 7-halogenase / FADH2 O2-dependent halogenase